jgi:hypothetical protein
LNEELEVLRLVELVGEGVDFALVDRYLVFVLSF